MDLRHMQDGYRIKNLKRMEDWNATGSGILIQEADKGRKEVRSQ